MIPVPRRTLSSLLLVASLLAPSRALAADDVVVLKNGGRLRGTVIESDPQKGVRIKLLDGALRVVHPAELGSVTYGHDEPAPAPAPPPPAALVAAVPAPSPSTGTLEVTATAPGRVYVDGNETGATPLHLDGLPAGPHRVRVVFDGGGSASTRALVLAGQPTKVSLEQSEKGAAYGFRQGARFGASAEPTSLFGKHLVLYGAALAPLVNFGLSPGVDIRLAIPFALLGNDPGLSWTLGLDASLRMNLASFYAIALGGAVSYLALPGTPDTCAETPPPAGACTTGGSSKAGLVALARLSPVIVRFGARIEWEAAGTVGVGVASDGSGSPDFAGSVAVSLTRLFL